MLFPYGQTEMAYLCQNDSHLAKVIHAVGKIERQVRPDVFTALISSIISQQISGKAAETVRLRVLSLVGGKLSPQKLAAIPDEALRSCGLSRQKTGYLHAAAQAALEGIIDFSALQKLPDEEVIARLTALPGVGRWTAEMLLIFSLCRMDVISYHDFGIRKGIQLLYGLEKLDKTAFQKYTAAYHPYATVASFYLWHIANNNLVL